MQSRLRRLAQWARGGSDSRDFRARVQALEQLLQRESDYKRDRWWRDALVPALAVCCCAKSVGWGLFALGMVLVDACTRHTSASLLAVMSFRLGRVVGSGQVLKDWAVALRAGAAASTPPRHYDN